MIRISIGSVGSGKTLLEVREMALCSNGRNTITNIKTDLKNQVDLTRDMIMKKEIVETKTKKSGETEIKYRYVVNKDFWQKLKEPVNVTLDEAHTILNSRRATSRINVVVSDWLALIRRVLGSSGGSYGELTFITQLPGRIDSIAREMATRIQHNICHYVKVCRSCHYSWRENSEVPEEMRQCLRCGSPDLEKQGHTIEVYYFTSIKKYDEWKMFGKRTYYKRLLFRNVSRLFVHYDTHQWDNLISEY